VISRKEKKAQEKTDSRVRVIIQPKTKSPQTTDAGE
jgi:lipopolysaccharide export system protein LptA